jgi:hypothetical protein
MLSIVIFNSFFSSAILLSNLIHCFDHFNKPEF